MLSLIVIISSHPFYYKHYSRFSRDLLRFLLGFSVSSLLINLAPINIYYALTLLCCCFAIKSIFMCTFLLHIYDCVSVSSRYPLQYTTDLLKSQSGYQGFCEKIKFPSNHAIPTKLKQCAAAQTLLHIFIHHILLHC